MQILIAIGVMLLVLVGVPGCWTVSTFNAFQSREQQVSKAWAKVSLLDGFLGEVLDPDWHHRAARHGTQSLRLGL